MSPDHGAIRARVNAATPGPWHGDHDEHGCVQQGNFGWVAPGTGPEYDVDSEQGHADAEFIAHAREDVPALLAEVERLAELVAQYAPIAVPILADMAARKERSARMAAHTHYCWTCSDGTAPGSGCHNCRQTGMDQTPCIGCPGPQTAHTGRFWDEWRLDDQGRFSRRTVPLLPAPHQPTR